MNPNEGRQSAHVTSRIVDKSNIVAPTEYLPLFTCLAPKGDSIEPVLIRNENSLIEEFGDPSINPDFYRDLVLIRDFVRAGKSCWVNRVAVEAKRFHYVYYLNNTIPVVYKLVFSYPNYASLTEEEKDRVNAGYYPSGSTNVRFQGLTGGPLDVSIDMDIIDIISRKDEIFEKTGWVVEVPDNPLISIAQKHNSTQQFSAQVSNGRKYITMKWQSSYNTEVDRRFSTSYYNLPLDSNGKIIRAADGSMPNITNYPDPDVFVLRCIPVTETSGDLSDYHKLELADGVYDSHYICNHSSFYFYKARLAPTRNLVKRTVYERTGEDPNYTYTRATTLVSGNTYYTNEKEGTTIGESNPKWEAFEYTTDSSIPYKPLYRLYLTSANASATSYYINANFEIVDTAYNIQYSLGSHRVYVDDQIILDKVNRTLHIQTEGGEITEDISTYGGYGTWGSVDPILRNRYGITINYPEGFSPEESGITSMDLTLISQNIDLMLFDMDSLLANSQDILTFTSVKVLTPSSAGIKINYVISGVDLTSTPFLITETIILPDKFTDQQFADKMNENPYINIIVNNPDSTNMYNVIMSKYMSNMTYTYTFNRDIEITLTHYQKSIAQYLDPKYYGNFICDLSYPLLKFNYDEWQYDIVNLTPDERRAIHFTIKTITSTRKDLLCILTTPNLSLDEACDWVLARGDYKDYWEYGTANALEYAEQSFYCEMYYGWLSYRTALVDGSPYKIKEIPSTIFVVRNIIESWMDRGISYPVAGDQGGVLNSNASLMNILNNPDTKAKRDKLVSYRINPIWDTGNRGIQIYGNETLNPLYTDLSAAHIARMLVMIKSRVDAYSETIKFSLNNQLTWDGWINYVSTRVLDPLKVEGGLVWYNVEMGYQTTDRSEIADRKIRGMVSLQFQQDLEIVDLEFAVYPSSLDMTGNTKPVNLIGGLVYTNNGGGSSSGGDKPTPSPEPTPEPEPPTPPTPPAPTPKKGLVNFYFTNKGASETENYTLAPFTYLYDAEGNNIPKDHLYYSLFINKAPFSFTDKDGNIFSPDLEHDEFRMYATGCLFFSPSSSISIGKKAISVQFEEVDSDSIVRLFFTNNGYNADENTTLNFINEIFDSFGEYIFKNSENAYYHKKQPLLYRDIFGDTYDPQQRDNFQFAVPTDKLTLSCSLSPSSRGKEAWSVFLEKESEPPIPDDLPHYDRFEAYLNPNASLRDIEINSGQVKDLYDENGNYINRGEEDLYCCLETNSYSENKALSVGHEYIYFTQTKSGLGLSLGSELYWSYLAKVTIYEIPDFDDLEVVDGYTLTDLKCFLKLTRDGHSYYYILDGVHDEWVNNPSAYGYSLEVPVVSVTAYLRPDKSTVTLEPNSISDLYIIDDADKEILTSFGLELESVRGSAQRIVPNYWIAPFLLGTMFRAQQGTVYTDNVDLRDMDLRNKEYYSEETDEYSYYVGLGNTSIINSYSLSKVTLYLIPTYCNSGTCCDTEYYNKHDTLLAEDSSGNYKTYVLDGKVNKWIDESDPEYQNYTSESSQILLYLSTNTGSQTIDKNTTILPVTCFGKYLPVGLCDYKITLLYKANSQVENQYYLPLESYSSPCTEVECAGMNYSIDGYELEEEKYILSIDFSESDDNFRIENCTGILLTVIFHEFS